MFGVSLASGVFDRLADKIIVLSCESAFAGGTPCDLCSDVPEEISKLDPNLYEYEDDSDLEESDVPGITGKGKAPENTSEKCV